MMYLRIVCGCLLWFFLSACVSGRTTNSKPTHDGPVLSAMAKHLELWAGGADCETALKNVRLDLSTVNTDKKTFSSGMPRELFQARLRIKDILNSGSSGSSCVMEAKRVLADLRALEERIGFKNLGRDIASAPSIPEYVFTDSHSQLFCNAALDETVRALTDLKTGDILLMHLPDHEATDVQREWNGIAVVVRDVEENVYMLEYDGHRVRQMSLTGSKGWLKRGVTRTQILRPKKDQPYATMTARWIGYRLKPRETFGDFLKKEMRLKTTTTLVGGEEHVLPGDMELSPDLNTVSEWKDYSVAHKVRVAAPIRLTDKMQGYCSRDERTSFGVTIH